ncbi:hypothetical protein FQR65_LT02245 [Abscondita terminalis]|nr:hypothetical protein FQR65_LT02245 [Abscondita terminalis]
MSDQSIFILHNRDKINSLPSICGICGVCTKSLSLAAPSDYTDKELRICFLNEVLKLNEFFFTCNECYNLVFRCTSGLKFLDHLRSLLQFGRIKGCFLCGSNDLVNKFNMRYDFSSSMVLIRLHEQYTYKTEVLLKICPSCEELYTNLTCLYRVIRKNPKYSGDEVASKRKERPLVQTQRKLTQSLQTSSNNTGDNIGNSPVLLSTLSTDGMKHYLKMIRKAIGSQCTTSSEWETNDITEVSTPSEFYLDEDLKCIYLGLTSLSDTPRRVRHQSKYEEYMLKCNSATRLTDISNRRKEPSNNNLNIQHKAEKEKVRDEKLNEECEYVFNAPEEKGKQDKDQNKIETPKITSPQPQKKIDKKIENVDDIMEEIEPQLEIISELFSQKIATLETVADREKLKKTLLRNLLLKLKSKISDKLENISESFRINNSVKNKYKSKNVTIQLNGEQIEDIYDMILN